MVKHLLVLPDGTEIFSGQNTHNALQRVVLTQQVNAGTELTLGSACANMLEVTLFTPGGSLHIAPGTELTLFQVEESGARRQVGLFTVEKTTRPSANRYQITAYDRVSWLDRDLSQWLESLDGWPYTLETFAHMVCSACNVSLTSTALPNGSWQIQKFSAGVTGRQLIQWVGQACGRFCRATADGQLEFAWYTPRDIQVTPGGECYYFMDSLQARDYSVARIDSVQIRQSHMDVGVTWGAGSNPYVITGNRLLATDTTAALEPVAQVLCAQLQDVTYTPCRVTVPITADIVAGDIVTVIDGNGQSLCMYVMGKISSGQRAILTCTGSPSRTASSAVNGAKLEEVNGKILELQVGIEGIYAQNREWDAKATELSLTVDGIKTKVSDHQAGLDNVTDRVSHMEQTAEGLSLKIKSVTDDGVSKVSTTAGYTFDENGLTVRKSGKEIKTQITEDGMTVYKSGREVLTANSQGVNAVDLHASTYLVIAGKSRFEKYKGTRVGCFWIGG